MEKHPATGSTVTEVTEGCTATFTGPLVTPWAVAVTIADPVTGLPDESLPLQTTNAESQTPPQIRPEGETVAILVFDELKVNVVETTPFAEFTAEALIETTWPATSEIDEGLMMTAATPLLDEEELPPHPGNSDRN